MSPCLPAYLPTYPSQSTAKSEHFFYAGRLWKEDTRTHSKLLFDQVSNSYRISISKLWIEHNACLSVCMSLLRLGTNSSGRIDNISVKAAVFRAATCVRTSV